MKTFYSLFLSSALLLSLLVTSCADQLNINPKGVLADDLLLGKPEHIDDFVTPCYSLIRFLLMCIGRKLMHGGCMVLSDRMMLTKADRV